MLFCFGVVKLENMLNFSRILNKKFLFVFIFILVLAAGGFFWWQNGKEIKGSPEDYEIIETAEGIFVENKKAGLIVKAPEGWEVKKMEFFEGSVTFNTSNIEGRIEDNMVKAPLKKGCAIDVALVYREFSFEELKEEIKEMHAGLGILSEEFEIITINNQQVLKNIFNSKFIGPGIGIYFFGKNKTYSFALYWAPDEKERCIQEFDSFLEAISIR